METMTTITKTATATTIRGTIINITSTAMRGYELKQEISFCDGDNVTINVSHKINDTSITLDVNGKKLTGTITTRRPSPNLPLFYGYFMVNDNKTVMPFDEDVYNTILNCKNEAVKEAEKDETWISMMEKESENRKMNKEYNAHVAAMNKMMNM